MPVIKLTTAHGLVFKRDVPQWGQHGTIKLTEKGAEKYFNYNGMGYEAPTTLYKIRWYLPSGSAHLKFHIEGQGTIALIPDHNAASTPLTEGTDRTVMIGKDGVLELTPPEPFIKGTPLSLKVQSIDATTCN